MEDDLSKIIRNLIQHKYEEEWFEFKMNWFEPHQLGEYISALSNSAALLGHKEAYFVWGIHNQTHEVLGSEFNYHQEIKNEPLKHYLARQLNQDIGFSFEEVIFQGKRLVLLVIPAAFKVPTAFDGVRYIRIGSSKENLMKYPDYESRLFFILRNGVPTVVNIESEFQDLSFNKLFLYFETKGVSLNRRTFKKNLRFLTESGKYNMLAQLLSDDNHIPIRFALFAGDTKTSTMYSVKEFGYSCLLFSLDQVLDYGKVLNIPQADERNRETVRKEVPLFNQRAYEEAVINAFVHNRWLDGNAPMFTCYRNRIDILSHGILPPGQTIEGFYAGESIPVNQALSDILIKLHITEHTGRGIPRITEVYGKDVISFKENSITVSIPFERIDTESAVHSAEIPPIIPQVGDRNPQVIPEIPPVDGHIPPVIPQVDDRNPQVIPQVNSIFPQDDEDLSLPFFRELTNIEQKITDFCFVPRGIIEISDYLGFKDRKTVRKYLKPLIETGRIARTIPDKPSSRFQKYVTIK